MSTELAARVAEALRVIEKECGPGKHPCDPGPVLADCWSEVRRLEQWQADQTDRLRRVYEEREAARAQLAAATSALGEGWLAGGATLAEGITRKTRVLEGLEELAPVLVMGTPSEADRAAFLEAVKQPQPPQVITVEPKVATADQVQEVVDVAVIEACRAQRCDLRDAIVAQAEKNTLAMSVRWAEVLDAFDAVQP